MKKLLIIAVAIISLISCDKHNTEIKGHLSKGKVKSENGSIALYNLDARFVQTFVDSVKVDKNGNFEFNFDVKETTFMMLHLDKTNFIT